MAEATLASELPPVTPANVPPLPTPGNLPSQIGQGTQVYKLASNALSSLQSGGDPGASLANLLGAGITLAAGQTNASTGTIVRTVVTIGSAVASGAAVGGPFGAAAGAVVGAVESLLQSVFGGGATFAGLTISSTPGSERLYKLVYQWGQANGGSVSGNPQGASLAIYLIGLKGPGKTRRPNLLWHLANQGGGSDSGMAAVGGSSGQAIGNPVSVTWPSSSVGESAFLSAVQPIVPSLLWTWASPASSGSQTTNPGAYASYYVDWGSAPGETQWKLDTKALAPNRGKPGLTVDQIMKSALARAPDPLYFASDLYVQNWNDGAGSDGIEIQNTETLCLLATILGLLGVGASTRAIAFEIAQQQMILSTVNAQPSTPIPSQAEWMSGQTFSSSYTETDALVNYKQIVAAQRLPNVPPLFRQLAEDYLLLAKMEEKNPHATMSDVISATANSPPAYIQDLLKASHTTSYLGASVHGGVPQKAPPTPTQNHALAAASKASAAKIVASFVQRYLGPRA